MTKLAPVSEYISNTGEYCLCCCRRDKKKRKEEGWVVNRSEGVARGFDPQSPYSGIWQLRIFTSNPSAPLFSDYQSHRRKEGLQSGLSTHTHTRICIEEGRASYPSFFLPLSVHVRVQNCHCAPLLFSTIERAYTKANTEGITYISSRFDSLGSFLYACARSRRKILRLSR